MPRRVAAVMQADVPSSARKVLRSTMVAGGYDALIQLWGQSVTDEVDGGNWLVKKEEAHRLPGQRHRDAKCAEACATGTIDYFSNELLTSL